MEASINLQFVKNISYEEVLRLVREANKYESYILIESEDISINVKGLSALSTIPFLKGALWVRAYGPDAEAAIDFTKTLLCKDVVEHNYFDNPSATPLP